MTRANRSSAGKAAVALAGSAVLFLAGCSSSSDASSNSSESPEESAAAEPVTLEMSWWGNDDRAKLFDQVVKAFEAKYPNITVTQTPVPDPDTLFNRLATDFAAGGDTAPDVFALGGAKPQEYGDAGALLDLAEVKDTVQLDKYPEFSLTNATVDDTVYGLPTGGNATAAFVNTDIFAKAGVEVPTDDWTWDDFVAAANKIGAAGLTTDTGAPIMGVDLRVQDILGTYAGQKTEYGFYDWDGKLSVKPAVIADWYKHEVALRDGKGLPDPSIVVQNWNISSDQQPYALGQAGITFGYSNLIGTYAKGGATKILLPPHDKGDKTGVALLPSAFWAINAKTAHPKEAALLVDWFLNEPEAAQLILDTRGVPFNPDTLAVVTPLLQGDSKAAAEYVQTTLDSGTVAPPQPNGGANANKYAQDGESDVLFDKASPDDAAKGFTEKLAADLNAAG
ncbi:ABC transporter substrate-binding protein [Xylanimonas protaetiae]|nr:extracellular solute-binding protein [Xylanimonas protaetiae]